LQRVALTLQPDPDLLNIEPGEIRNSQLFTAFSNLELFTKANSQRYTGYLRVKDELRPLPIGSTLDSARGVFYWQPGPGFIGKYELVFLKKDSLGNITKHSLRNINKLVVQLKIRPKF